MPKKTASGGDITSALHEVEASRLRSKYADLNEKYKELLARASEADDRLDAIIGLKDRIAGHAPMQMSVKASGRTGESTAVIVSSDWHVEERVDPKTVDGVNEYTPEIATRRVKNHFERGLAMVEMCRTRSKIDTLILALLGDEISGGIHQELRESNYLSATEATLKCYRLICGGIDFLLKEGGFKRILVPCSHGNHGRNTDKMRVATAAKNSYEWMLYHIVAQRYADEPRIQFQIADGYFNFVQVYDYLLRLHHGHAIRYQGGVGTLTIPLNKSIAQWNKMRKADVDVLGHWHTRMSTRDAVVNGSIIGYNAFAIEIKASYEPPCQSFFLMHPERGKTVEIPLFVD